MSDKNCNHHLLYGTRCLTCNPHNGLPIAKPPTENKSWPHRVFPESGSTSAPERPFIKKASLAIDFIPPGRVSIKSIVSRGAKFLFICIACLMLMAIGSAADYFMLDGALGFCFFSFLGGILYAIIVQLLYKKGK